MITATKTLTIKSTCNYRIFILQNEDNRVLNIKKHGLLMKSLEKYGFLPYWPMVVERTGKKLLVKDGQHRLAIAQQLKIPVYYIILVS